MAKPKVAFYWCASCGGCEEAVVDLNENLLVVADAVDIVFWPVAMDFKKRDVEAMQDGEIAVSFINGAIRLEEQEEMVHLMRRKSGLVVAFGACAHLGGIPGLGNFHDRKSIFDRQFLEAPTMVNPEGVLPQTSTMVDVGELTLPAFFDTVQTLDQTIDVDYYLPGCPPPPDLILNAVNAILEGKLPAKGAVLAPTKALCETCPVRDSKPEKMAIREVRRPWQVRMDPEKCFLSQGVICMGPATRSGCGESCIRANMPCRGCFGPVEGVEDQGAAALAMVASMLGLDAEESLTEAQEAELINSVPDPAGTFYRFSLAGSLLRRKRL
ncbi:F420-nonreducing hydrogenase [Desulfatitalea alkaliphila]|uniref:F420-nonreducing hydrogenase n=1 Tax=Desulfatitalea alkaliphila TaxID=2929485 RepID=A0AA41R543_9BACT|nr:F420-nonreducing hydrogenase [Desulfatitalea alkaliphila]MCJ8502027.1 F420-nonreducing hydrogenase [Desulfatitalea alkaliphila]